MHIQAVKNALTGSPRHSSYHGSSTLCEDREITFLTQNFCTLLASRVIKCRRSWFKTELQNVYLFCFTLNYHDTACDDTVCRIVVDNPASLTLGVSSMENSKSDRAVHLMLAGDDHGVEQSSLSSVIQCICQRDCRA